MNRERNCEESCFLYDPERKGCSYYDSGFESRESVEPGQRCLHPDFSDDDLLEITLCSLLAIL